MTSIPQPGLNTARLYAWVALLGPVLLFAGSVGLVAVGVWQDEDVIATS
jgi:hypothetical protein